MKNFTIIPAITIAIVTISYSCSKEDNKDRLKADLNVTESLLIKTFQEAKSNDDSLKKYVNPNIQIMNPFVFIMDSLYHMNDSLCNFYYLTYCEQMMKGDNMMGGNMMGGDTMHGSGMMAMHAYMGGDTATVNQFYRKLIIMRQEHPSHHPVKPNDHESHHQ